MKATDKPYVVHHYDKCPACKKDINLDYMSNQVGLGCPLCGEYIAPIVLPEPLYALDKQVGGEHYKLMKIQPIEYISANSLNFMEGNIIKYISRHREKNGVDDLRKARHMLELLAELEYGEEL